MIEQTLDIMTAAGQMETFICWPERAGPFPAVFLLMDAPGIREELSLTESQNRTSCICVG